MTQEFTTRPDVTGHFGVATSTHWLASQTAMRMLEIGGTAFDAAVAGGFVLQVAEPHLNGPLGEVPILLHHAKTRQTRVVCGQGPAPAAATIEHFQDQGLTQIPGTGLLATAIPGAFDAWMLMLRDYGTLSLSDVLQPAIDYAEHGVPVTPRMLKSIVKMQDWFLKAWPDNAAIYLDNGDVPKPGALIKNPALGRMYRKVLEAAQQGGRDRETQIETARSFWKTGFIAETIDAFCRETSAPDVTGQKNSAVLRGDDLAGWRAHYETPQTTTFCGKTVCKTGPWGQGPVLLQCLNLITQHGMDGVSADGPEFYHLLIETMKLCFADRDTYYCDPNFGDVPLTELLSPSYAAKRSSEISDMADTTWRPGVVPGFGYPVDYTKATQHGSDIDGLSAMGVGEPTAKTGPSNGDTCHINVVDRFGNLVSATPSGGWMESSPVIPALGIPLGTRLQMMSLNPDSMDALEPGKRPRTTLTPSLILNDDGSPYMACGTPGGDKQDQWQLAFLVRHLMYGQGLQQAIDAPGFSSAHWPDSFFPRQARPGHMSIESRAGDPVIDALRARGHHVTVGDAWSEGWVCASRIRADGVLSAAASPRGMQAYAVGR